LTDLLLPDPEDYDDLALRLIRWKNNRAEYKKRVEPFAKKLREYSWDHMARDFLEAIA